MKKLVLALAAVALIATPALADYSFYGSARVNTFYTVMDDGNPATDDAKDFNVALQANSRFGAKATTGDVSGRVEFGYANAAGAVYTRLLYGEVKLGDGTLLVGQTYAPYVKFSSSVANGDLGFDGYGALYDGRQPMIKYSHDSGVYFAAINNDGFGGEIVIPKLNLGYMGSASDINYNAGVVFQTAKTAADSTESAYLLYLCGDAKFGDAGLVYGIHYGSNISDIGIGGGSNSPRNAALNATGDAKSWGGMLEASMNGATLGFGYVSDEPDGAADADTQMAIFANYKISVAKGFAITPEVAYFDFMESTAGADEGDDLYVGAKWQMDF